MANAYVVPFDFKPVDTKEFGALSYSYTVPAGKYAIVNYSICTSAAWDHSNGSISNHSQTSGNNSHGGQLILIAGDILTRSVSAPSNTDTLSAAGTVVTASAELRVNGNAVAYVQCSASVGTTGTTVDFVQVTSATTHAFIQEYNIAT